MKDELDAQIAQERLDPGEGSHSVQDRIICSMFNRRPKSMPVLPCVIYPPITILTAGVLLLTL